MQKKRHVLSVLVRKLVDLLLKYITSIAYYSGKTKGMSCSLIQPVIMKSQLLRRR